MKRARAIWAVPAHREETLRDTVIANRGLEEADLFPELDETATAVIPGLCEAAFLLSEKLREAQIEASEVGGLSA